MEESVDITRHDNSEIAEDSVAAELVQYTKEKLPRYGWLFAQSVVTSDPGTTHAEG